MTQAFDCRTCGACCREAFDCVPVEATDDVPPELVHTYDDGFRIVARVPSPLGKGTRCAALTEEDGCFSCVIYARRPGNCRELEPGSEGCLTARRRVGIDPWPEGVKPDGPLTQC